MIMDGFHILLKHLLIQVGHFTYEGKGAYTMHKHKGVVKHLSMLAGGTGEEYLSTACIYPLNILYSVPLQSLSALIIIYSFHLPASHDPLWLLTGITPCYAVLMAVLKDPEDRTTTTLIFANQTEEDILLKAELDTLAGSHPDRFKVSDGKRE